MQDKEPRGIIPLENLSIREVEDSKKPVSIFDELLQGDRRDGRSNCLTQDEVTKVYR